MPLSLLPPCAADGDAESEKQLLSVSGMGVATLRRVRESVAQWDGLRSSLAFCRSLSLLSEAQISSLVFTFGAVNVSEPDTARTLGTHPKHHHRGLLPAAVALSTLLPLYFCRGSRISLPPARILDHPLSARR